MVKTIGNLSKKHKLFYLKQGTYYLAIFLSAIIAFFNSLFNGFVLDDRIHILANEHIRSFANIFECFTTAMYPGNLYRPLVEVSYLITYSLFEYDPLPYHLTNILLHALNALLVFNLFSLLISRKKAAALALLFAVHPVLTEVVANVSGRAELLAALFGLIWLRIGVLKEFKAKHLLQGVVLFLALCSKESALGYVCILPLISIFTARKLTRATVVSSAIALLCYLGLRMLAIGSLFGSAVLIDVIDNPLVTLSWYERIVNALSLLGSYFVHAFLPLPLSADYSFAEILPLAQQSGSALFLSLFSLAVCLLLLSLVVIERDKKSNLLLGSSWFFLAFLVTSNLFFPIGTIFAERLLYTPLIGVLLLATETLSRLPSRISKAVVLGVVLFFATIFSARHSEIWRDDRSLYQYQIDISPHSAKTHVNYGAVMASERREAEAEVLFRKALSIAPHYAEAHYALGALYLRKFDFYSAEGWFRGALQANGSHVPSICALATVLHATGKTDEAERYYLRALTFAPQNFEARAGIFAIMIDRKNRAAAKEIYQTIKQQHPNDPRLRELEKLLR